MIWSSRSLSSSICSRCRHSAMTSRRTTSMCADFSSSICVSSLFLLWAPSSCPSAERNYSVMLNMCDSLASLCSCMVRYKSSSSQLWLFWQSLSSARSIFNSFSSSARFYAISFLILSTLALASFLAAFVYCSILSSFCNVSFCLFNSSRSRTFKLIISVFSFLFSLRSASLFS